MASAVRCSWVQLGNPMQDAQQRQKAAACKAAWLPRWGSRHRSQEGLPQLAAPTPSRSRPASRSRGPESCVGGQASHSLPLRGQPRACSVYGAGGVRGVRVRRYEVEKLTASQRLDLNLEKGRMRDELQVGPTSATGLRPAALEAFYLAASGRGRGMQDQAPRGYVQHSCCGGTCSWGP